MASVNVSNISLVNYNQSNINISGFNIEHYRIAAPMTWLLALATMRTLVWGPGRRK